ncbi:MAG: nucleoside 2-deoxyribosyltransferase [Acidimicrobiales bacterium]|nr:nucleoside 2-deoxyribosyltransferase [Acidimicrobiales bacterium]
MPVHVYVAGPLFNEGERWFMEVLEARIAAAGASTFLPHRDNPDKTVDNMAEIYRNNVGAIDSADLVVANLNGIATDDGTAWEVGYAVAKGIPVVGLFTDWRRRFDDEIVNLMIGESSEAIVRSLDELDADLASRLGGG